MYLCYSSFLQLAEILEYRIIECKAVATFSVVSGLSNTILFRLWSRILISSNLSFKGEYYKICIE